MKNIFGTILFIFFYSQHTYYTLGGIYYWLYLLIIILFIILHYDARLLLRKHNKNNTIYISANFLVSITSSLIFLFSTIFFAYFLVINNVFNTLYQNVVFTIFYLSHISIALYYTFNFIKSYRKNNGDYIAISNQFIEYKDNDKITKVDLNSINKSERLEIKNGFLIFGDQKVDIKQIGLTTMSSIEVERMLNSLINNRAV
jgi:hypothetical protein